MKLVKFLHSKWSASCQERMTEGGFIFSCVTEKKRRPTKDTRLHSQNSRLLRFPTGGWFWTWGPTSREPPGNLGESLGDRLKLPGTSREPGESPGENPKMVGGWWLVVGGGWWVVGGWWLVFARCRCSAAVAYAGACIGLFMLLARQTHPHRSNNGSKVKRKRLILETNRRQSARAAKQAQRAKAPEINPCPPGQSGGQYKPLSDSQVKTIYNESLRILEQIGMTDVPKVLEKQALAHGAKINSQNRLCFPATMVESIISSACKEFTFYGRESKHDIVVGGDKVYFGTGGAAVQTLDIDTEEYRPSTLADLYDFTRLIDQLPNVSWFTRCCIATDVHDNYELDVNTAFALLKGTTKPVGMSFHIDEHVDPIIDMFDMALGGKGKFSEKPFCKAHISPVISPLKFGEDALATLQACRCSCNSTGRRSRPRRCSCNSPGIHGLEPQLLRAPH